MTSVADLDHTLRTTETVTDLVSDVVRLLNEAGETLGVAESLTSGSLMAAITSVPGSGSVFRGGVVSYATPLKQTLLGVDEALISREGVIHGEVAVQMAEGARRVTSFDGGDPTTWGIGTTGEAGPDPQDDKPPGTVYIGIASPGGSRAFGPFGFPGSRERVREATVLEALARLRDELAARGGEKGAKDA
ncbi:hypothetical protein MFIFM68171_03650 [Madurella fahalii]|uniref:CinA C-terminal domain-containing protein n=1 Tax=Madurella fahalii TaxID=1157608 RepID=A0ABQ0G781_9PEZI